MNKKDKKEYFRALGAKGGKATAKKYGSKHFIEMARKSNEAQWETPNR